MSSAANDRTGTQERAWYYLKFGVAQGPMTVDELRALALPRDTLVWRKGMADWEALSQTSIAAAVAAQALPNRDLPPPPPVQQLLRSAAAPESATTRTTSAEPSPQRRETQDRRELKAEWFLLTIGIVFWVFVFPPIGRFAWNLGQSTVDAFAGGQHRANIERVLRADKEQSECIAASAGFGDQYWDASAIIGRVVDSMQSIDMSGCPADFQEAYRDHIKAWQKVHGVATRYGGMNGFVQGFLSLGTAMGDALDDSNAASHEVMTTYQNLLQSAKRHGVDVTQYQRGQVR